MFPLRTPFLFAGGEAATWQSQVEHFFASCEGKLSSAGRAQRWVQDPPSHRRYKPPRDTSKDHHASWNIMPNPEKKSRLIRGSNQRPHASEPSALTTLPPFVREAENERFRRPIAPFRSVISVEHQSHVVLLDSYASDASNGEDYTSVA